jgi:hypothetical protein
VDRNEVLLDIERHMQAIAAHFVEDARMTLVVRVPDNDRATVMLTTDTRAGALRAVSVGFGMQDQQEVVRARV